MQNITSFLINFVFNLLVALILVRGVYYPSTHKKGFVLTFLAFNTVIYLVMTFLTTIELGIGVGFGLFAIFTILRYRTDPIPIREMTYLFVVAALPVINSLSVTGEFGLHLAISNAALLVMMWVLEKEWGFRYEASKRIVYEKIELVHQEKRAELLADLEARTGLKIKRVYVEKIDYLHDTASIQVIYDDPSQEAWLSNGAPLAAASTKDDD
jgi:hypothetical protein